METAFETNFILTNPMLAYRCLSELDWLNSKKVEEYLAHLKADNSINSKLILLYYWGEKSYSPEFKKLLTDKELIDFVAPNQIWVDMENEICDRLFAFENYISELHNTSRCSLVDKKEFERLAENFFNSFIKPVDTN